MMATAATDADQVTELLRTFNLTTAAQELVPRLVAEDLDSVLLPWCTTRGLGLQLS